MALLALKRSQLSADAKSHSAQFRLVGDAPSGSPQTHHDGPAMQIANVRRKPSPATGAKGGLSEAQQERFAILPGERFSAT